MFKQAFTIILTSLCLFCSSEAASDVSVLPKITKGGGFKGKNPKVFTPKKATATAGKGPITSALNTGKSVVVRTESNATAEGILRIAVPITKKRGKNATLTFQSEGPATLETPILCLKKTLSVTFESGAGGEINAPITTNGGDITINTSLPFTLGAAIDSGTGRVVIQAGAFQSSAAQTVKAQTVDIAASGGFHFLGTVSGDLNVAGTVSPGASGTGPLQVTGALNLQAGSTTEVNLGGTGKGSTYGNLSVSGSVTLGGTLKVDCINGFEDLIVPNQTFTIINGGAIIGTFDGLQNGGRVFLPDELGSLKITYSETAVTLSEWQPIFITAIWDPGLEDAGTQVYTNARARGRRHYFQIRTEETDIGAWRSRLNPTSGEADLYLSRGTLPSTTSSLRRSTRVGADGFVLNPTEFAPSQDWIALVYADPGTPWTFLTGRAFVQDLGALRWTDSDMSGTYNVGEPAIPSVVANQVIEGEGMRFYKATVPVGTLGWSLWLGGSNQDIAIRKALVPFPSAKNLYDAKQAGRMLVVPPYLGSETTTYFLSVAGDPGDPINLDSRIQEVVDIPYDTTLNDVQVPGAPYRVYRVQVPVDQIAWDVSTKRNSGDPNVAVRRNLVPAEFENDGFSEVPGDVTDGITLVPPFLTNGAWFITVYGESSYGFDLRNGPPVVTPIAFTDTKTNGQVLRTGWRYYGLSDIPSQFGAPGWELALTNQIPGTEIALRRNAVPSRWRSRKDGQSTIIKSQELDLSGTEGFLQNPFHQPDVWYVGVYSPAEPLGAFTLDAHPILPPSASFDGGSRTIQNLKPGYWEYVRVTVPAGAAGWDIRVRDVSGPNPKLSVRRDLLPALTKVTLIGSTQTTWPTGSQRNGGIDWTDLDNNPAAVPGGLAILAPPRLLSGTGMPLEAGTYYVGVYNPSRSEELSCTVDSRGIGTGLTYQMAEIDYEGGSDTFDNLAPREANYYKVTIPDNQPSWELLLQTTTGESELVVRRGAIPDFEAVNGGDIYLSNREIEMAKLGPERYVLLPSLGTSTIPPGDYYVEVIGAGESPSGNTIGSGTSGGVLTSVGPLPVTELGTPTQSGITHPVSLFAGQITAYHFDVPQDAQSLEIRLQKRVGASAMVVIPGDLIPKPAATYGADGGNGGTPINISENNTLVLTVSNPTPGKWSIALNAGIVEDAAAELFIKVLGVTEIDFDGGTTVVTAHQQATVQYFYVDVPAGATGWDFRMRDVSGPMPKMSVRRDVVPGPPGLVTPGWPYWTFDQWPNGYQTEGTTDWTGYSQNPGGTPLPPRLVTGVGRPLEPGRYYISVANSSSTQAIDYTLESRGIGDGMTYPVRALNVSGDAPVNIDDLAPREARYYKVAIPSATPAWEVTLSADVGELELLARAGTIPDFAASNRGSLYANASYGLEVEMQKAGPERYVLMAPQNQDYIPPGDYYLAIVSEGLNPAGSTIGSGSSSGKLQSRALPMKDLGTANPAGTVEQVDLAPAQAKAYSFQVPAGTDSLEVKLDDTAGVAWVSLAPGTRLPRAPGEPLPGQPVIGVSPHNDYGADGGTAGTANVRILTVANPAPGDWRVVVRAGHDLASPYAFNTASGNLVVTALSTIPLAYDGGTSSVSAQEPGTWRYFGVEVPEGVAGWDIRVRDVAGPVPSMMVRRGELPAVPVNLIPGNLPNAWAPESAISWPIGNQWLGRIDWTEYPTNPGGVTVGPRLVAGIGRPLEAGFYFVGVYNNKLSSSSYTVESRGIGNGRTFPVTELNFAGGSGAITDVPARDAAYFKVNVPANAPSWEVSLDPNVGEMGLVVRSGAIPDFTAVRAGNIYSSNGAVKMKKAGSDRYVLLPNVNQDFIPAGDYYFAAVSEGVNPRPTESGSGNSSGTISSHGNLVAVDLGTATVAGIEQPIDLLGGQIKAYQFTVAPDTDSLEIRLEGTGGFPAMRVVAGNRFPIPPGLSPLGTSPHSEYGFDGGTAGVQAVSIHTVPSPAAGTWTILVRARHDPAIPAAPADAFFPNASGNLTIRSKPNLPLNFAESLNSNGGTHTDTRQAVADEYNIYQVPVPAALDGKPVLGWMINTEILQGAVSLEVYKDFANPASGITVPIGVAILAPPFLTFDEPWYIRVKANGLTTYRITSRPITLERSPWAMPSAHNQTFGDSGYDEAGNPLPGDRGVDLQQGYWHFYAIDVPEDNQGLLKTEIQAISGNPDLYLREDGVPTIDHRSNGRSGASLAPRYLTGATTSYGNWVPIAGKTETRLRPGRWYLGVRASGNSNVRYRLIASTGVVQSLSLDPAGSTPQLPNAVAEVALPDNDWRYFRFVVPNAAPKNWTVKFNQLVGDVVMWVRDTVPPGQIDSNTRSASDIADWAKDAKNQGPYLAGYDLPGSYTFSTPPLRPGHVYYVGMRSNNSATFAIESNTEDGAIDVAPALDFESGTVTTTVPANSSISHRIIVPANGTRFKYTATHPSAISVRIEQGTVPNGSGPQHFVSTLANSSLNRALSVSSWPWVPGQTYYVCFTNSAASGQSITFAMDGKTALTEDEDNDGLLDAWEQLHFGNLSQTPAGDADNDGSSNGAEFADGTVPTDTNSAKYSLFVVAKNGTASAGPIKVKYDKGEHVMLETIPTQGYDFIGWTGGPFDGDNFAISATGTITIPAAGTWTFGVNAADGSRLKVDGVAYLTDNTSHDVRDTFAQINLGAGTHTIELTAFERADGEGLELFAALGSFTSFGPEFRLVGDVPNGGLAVETVVDDVATPGFLVRQVQASSALVTSLSIADGLLAGTTPARQSIMGLIDSLNFLTYSWSEGHFDDNANFPLADSILDNPLNLTMNGNYTIVALHSIPLGAALDAENLNWWTGGTVPWLGEMDPAAADSIDAAGSGPIGEGQTSYLQTVVTGPGTLTFRWKVSSHSGDNLGFLRNGVSQATISGEVGWELRSFSIPAGVHTLTWRYVTGGAGTSGSDRGWLDQVTFSPQ